MQSKILAGSALFVSSLASIVTPSVDAADPTITPGPNYELFRKQNDARFMGWVELDDVWTSQDCDLGGTLYQTDGHWRCCATSAASCDIPRACVSGSLIYGGSSLGLTADFTVACTKAYDDPAASSWSVCNTAFLYENDRDSSPETNVNCGPSSYNWSYYRSEPTDAKTTSTPTQPRSSTASATGGAGNDPNPTLIPESSDSSPKKKSSKAWIAGVVVGPLLGIALIGFLAWFCIRKKKSKKAAAAPPAATYNPQSAAPAGPNSPPQYYPPPMQQQGAGMAPFGVADGKPNTWAPQPQSPVSQASSPNPLSMYGNQYSQQGGHTGPGQPVYNAPSPSMSPLPQPAYAETNATYQHAHEVRPFSSELDGSPQVVNVQPKTN